MMHSSGLESNARTCHAVGHTRMKVGVVSDILIMLCMEIVDGFLEMSVEYVRLEHLFVRI